MSITTYLINNDEHKKIFSNLNNVFSNLNNVFSNIDKDYFKIVESDIIKELKHIYSKINHKKEILRTKIYKEIFYFKKNDISVDVEEYIRYMKIFEDEVEDEYNEFKRIMKLIEDKDEGSKFQVLIDEYYSINQLVKAIKIYINTNS